MALRQNLVVGAEIQPVTIGPIQKTQLVRYAGASGDFNPIHFDEEFARRAGYEKNLVHGMLNMGILASVLTDWNGKKPLRSIQCRFKSVVFQGESLTCGGRVESLGDVNGVPIASLSIWAKNPRGETVLEGSATVDVDS